MNGQDSLRAHLEAIRDEAVMYPQAVHGDSVRRHAVAALAILDNAPLDIFASRFDRVPASEWVDAVRLAPETRHVSIPDPVPVVSPRPNQQERKP